ncbi:polysaccharide biosynthesis C-terminal domain-containing protein [Actinocorallia sp. API 0066]|uniref:oligosaccharide flippase family protein n=1 Tax=Actinocorallia sp. API 0066 TaxID=2896846 RepID=UPI001E4596CC|nr:polysaccharide biosynthesis C-terminal domain-containing protein [Actinocorallia sp. API 0066]MCD0447815.1 polysaccharide biosynthesis C-terminal domain-containing protein [Actinocorallia sp. API 0066]
MTEAPPRAALRETARGGMVGLLGAVVGAAGGFALTVVVARALGPETTGVFFIVVALVTIVGEITELGADTGLVRMAAAERALGRTGALRHLLRTALVPVAIVSVLAAAVLALLVEPLLPVLFDGGLDEAELFLYLGVPAVAVWALRTVALAGTRGLGSVASFALVNNVALPAARPLLVLACLVLGLPAWTVMASWTLPAVAAAGVALWLLWRVLRRVERDEPPTAPAPPRRETTRAFWSFSGVRGVAAAVEIAIIWLDVLIVGAMVAAFDAGLYATTSRFITTGTLVLAATRIAIAPQISALLARGAKPEAERLNAVATTWIVAGSWPLYLVLALGGPFVLTLFGPEFAEGATALAILSGAMLVSLLAGNVQTVLLMGGKSSWSLANKALALAVMIVADLLLVPSHGIVGAAVGWALTMVVSNGLAAVQVRYGMRLRLLPSGPLKVALGALVCFGGAGLAVRAALGMDGPAFALMCASGGIAYAGVLYALRSTLHLDELLGAVRRGKGRREHG